MAEEKTNKKGQPLIIVGALLVILALTADWLGLGNDPAFGFKQIALLVVGLVILLLGLKSCKCSK